MTPRSTPLRIYATSKPSQIGAPVLPMSEHDRLWSHTRAIARKAERN